MSSGNEHITTIEKEMGITHADFYATLAALLDGIPYKQDENYILFQWNGKKAEVKLGPEGIREIGPSVRLPVTHVIICLFSFSQEEVDTFMHHFDLKFMRGGG